MVRYGAYSLDPHASLGFRLGSLSMFSQLQVPFVLQRSVKGTVTIRAALLYIYVLIIFTTAAVGFHVTNDRLGVIAGMMAICGAAYSFMVEFSSRPLQVMEQYCNEIMERLQTKFESRKRFIWIPGISDIYFFLLIRKHIARKPWIQFIFGFSICALLTLYFLAQALIVKYGNSGVEGCDLNIAAENEWTLSQIYAILMVVALLLPATDAYLGVYTGLATLARPETNAVVEMVDDNEGEASALESPGGGAQTDCSREIDEHVDLIPAQSGRRA